MSNEGAEPTSAPSEEEALMAASIGQIGETISRRRSPDSAINISANVTRLQSEEPSVVLDIGTGESGGYFCLDEISFGRDYKSCRIGVVVLRRPSSPNYGNFAMG